MFEDIEDSEMLLLAHIKSKLEKSDINIVIFSDEEKAFLQKLIKNTILRIGQYVFNGESDVEECVKKIYSSIIEKNQKLFSLMSE